MSEVLDNGITGKGLELHDGQWYHQGKKISQGEAEIIDRKDTDIFNPMYWMELLDEKMTNISSKTRAGLAYISPDVFPGNFIGGILDTDLARATGDVGRRTGALLVDGANALKESAVINALELLDHIKERSESAKSFQEYLIAWFITHNDDPEFQDLLKKDNISKSIGGEIDKIQAVLQLNSRSEFYCLSGGSVELIDTGDIVCVPEGSDAFTLDKDIYNLMHEFFLQNRDFSSSKTREKIRTGTKGPVSKQEDKKIRDMFTHYTSEGLLQSLDPEITKLVDDVAALGLDSIRISRDEKGGYILLAQSERGKIDGRVYIPFRQMEYLVLDYHSSLTNDGPVGDLLSKVGTGVTGLVSYFLEAQKEKYYNDGFEYALQNLQSFSDINTDPDMLEKLKEISIYTHGISVEFLPDGGVKIGNTEFSTLETQRIVGFKDSQTWLTR